MGSSGITSNEEAIGSIRKQNHPLQEYQDSNAVDHPICDEGKSIMEYAIEFNSVKAQAQIIIIRA